MKNDIGKIEKENYYIKAIYNSNEYYEKKVKILGEEFVKNNKNKCKIVYKNNIYELKVYLEDIDKNYNHKDLVIIKIIFIHDIINLSYMFYNCNCLISLTDNIKTNVSIHYLQIYSTNLKFMFFRCSSLISLPDISKWDTSNVNYMAYMFFGCSSLISLPDLSKLDTSNVNNMNGMFYECYSLISLPDISKWDTSNVNDMKYMFYKCSSLISLPDISKWNTSRVNEMKYMFYKCSSLISLPDISKWDTSNVKDMCFMFLGCKYLFKLPLFYLINKDNDNIIFEVTFRINKNKRLRILGKKFIENNFYNCIIIYKDNAYELKEYFEDIDNIDHKDIVKFFLCLNKKINDISYLFYECDSLISVDYYQINSQSNEINDKFDTNINLNNSIISSFSSDLELYSFPMSTLYNNKVINTLSEKENFEIFFQISFIQLINMNSMFFKCSSLISLPDISKWDTSNVNYMNRMFYDCSSLISLPDISKWNTSNVNNMYDMFHGCSSLISLPDISKWDTSNVNYMHGIFHGCSSIMSLPDISKWNTSKINYMNDMFHGCSSLISLPDISKWDTSNIETMEYMFYKCSSLISLPDISKWDTSNVNDMKFMFVGCSSLISLPDISKWDTSNVNDMKYMFYGCSSLISLPDLISKWKISNYYNYVNFRDCFNCLIYSKNN